VNTGYFRIVFPDPADRTRSQQQIADYINRNLRFFPGAKAFVLQEQTISIGTASKIGFPVRFVLQAANFDKLREYLPRFMDSVAKDTANFLGFDSDLKFNKPELVVTIDRERAKTLGISVLDIAHTLQLAFSGSRMSYFIINGKQYQVIGQFDRANRDEPLDLKSIYIRNKDGGLVQMDNLVKVVEQVDPPQLYHFNRYESATVSAGLAPGKTIGDGINAMNRIAANVLDKSFTTSLTGPARDFAESSSNIVFAFVLALILIYLVLAAQFESFIDPFIIMLTVPLALAGALISLWYFNLTLNIFSEIGIIVLIGLVTKNGILIVEFANQRREQGLSIIEAVKDASASRLRPILMTSLATALGALPIALALGSGSTSRVSLGIVVIGGLMFSLILTLFVIPAMYTYMTSKKKHSGSI
jgi:multidrug efflux pump